MRRKQEYEVRLELFEGPLDLLLYLVNKAEVAITDIPVAEIARQYLEYLDLMRDLNINVAGEYLSLAATLVRLKARELFPDDPAEEQEDEDGIYTREQLIAHLIRYRAFKEAAESLKTQENEQSAFFPRGRGDTVDPDPAGDDPGFGDVGIYDLLAAFKRILDRQGETDEVNHVVRMDEVRLDDRIEWVLGMLGDADEVPFEVLFRDDTRRMMKIVTFMAILELVKMQKIFFRQERTFDRIFVRARPDEPFVDHDAADTTD